MINLTWNSFTLDKLIVSKTYFFLTLKEYAFFVSLLLHNLNKRQWNIYLFMFEMKPDCIFEAQNNQNLKS